MLTIQHLIITSTSAHSSKNGPTITGIPRPPITIIPISIESNTGTSDSGISSTDSTANSIHPSAASAQSTEVRCCLSCYLVHIFLLYSIV